MAERERSTTTTLLAGAIAFGLASGVGSLMTTADGRAAVARLAERVDAASRVERTRPPRAGDFWGGCNDARAAGTAPIYRDEPGYRPDMDGDGDGIACEPVRS